MDQFAFLTLKSSVDRLVELSSSSFDKLPSSEDIASLFQLHQIDVTRSDLASILPIGDHQDRVIGIRDRLLPNIQRFSAIWGGPGALRIANEVRSLSDGIRELGNKCNFYRDSGYKWNILDWASQSDDLGVTLEDPTVVNNFWELEGQIFTFHSIVKTVMEEHNALLHPPSVLPNTDATEHDPFLESIIETRSYLRSVIANEKIAAYLDLMSLGQQALGDDTRLIQLSQIVDPMLCEMAVISYQLSKIQNELVVRLPALLEVSDYAVFSLYANLNKGSAKTLDDTRDKVYTTLNGTQRVLNGLIASQTAPNQGYSGLDTGTFDAGDLFHNLGDRGGDEPIVYKTIDMVKSSIKWTHLGFSFLDIALQDSWPLTLRPNIEWPSDNQLELSLARPRFNAWNNIQLSYLPIRTNHGDLGQMQTWDFEMIKQADGLVSRSAILLTNGGNGVQFAYWFKTISSHGVGHINPLQGFVEPTPRDDRGLFNLHAGYSTFEEATMTLFECPENSRSIRCGNVQIHDWSHWPTTGRLTKVTFANGGLPDSEKDKIRVFVALSGFDTRSQGNIKIQLTATNVDSKGFTLCISCSEETKLDGVGVGYVAVVHEQ